MCTSVPWPAEIDPLEMARIFPNATVMLTMQGMMRAWNEDGLVRFRPWFDADALGLIDIAVFSEEDICSIRNSRTKCVKSASMLW